MIIKTGGRKKKFYMVAKLSLEKFSWLKSYYQRTLTQDKINSRNYKYLEKLGVLFLLVLNSTTITHIINKNFILIMKYIVSINLERTKFLTKSALTRQCYIYGSE